MRTIRRLYFYGVSFISLEVVLWGGIGLARHLVAPQVVAGVDQLARALALILVGVPVFAMHWWAAQRRARQEAEERISTTRAAFLYGILLSLLIPMVQNALALLARGLARALSVSPKTLFIGGGQSLSDNLIAILLNGVLAVYFVLVLRDDWAVIGRAEAWRDMRRLYRHIWVVYGLGLSLMGTQRILRYLFSRPVPTMAGQIDRAWLVDGLTGILIGLPLWLAAWQTVRRAMDEERSERESLLHLVVIYLLVLPGVLAALSACGILLTVTLRYLLGETMTFRETLGEIGGPLSMGIPMGVLWAYHAHHLHDTLRSMGDATRREGALRLYRYALALLGLGGVLIGLASLLAALIDLASGNMVGFAALRTHIAQAMAAILVAFPLWLRPWVLLQAEAWGNGPRRERGENARRSTIRRGYLYLVLFVGVVGGMGSAGRVLFLLLRWALGERPSHFTQDVLSTLRLLVLFAALLGYHLWVLRRDGRLTAQTLRARQERYPVLIVDPGDGVFGTRLETWVTRQAPHVPLAVRSLEEGLTPEEREAFKAVILPESLAVEPPEAFRLWLREFDGIRLVVPGDSEEARGWVWLRGGRFSPQRAAARAGQVVRQLAEEGTARPPAVLSPWAIVASVVVTLIALLTLLSALMEALD